MKIQGENSYIVNGVQCSAEDKDGELVIDLRPAGFLENSIPRELLDHPKIRTILLFHKSVPKILESNVDKLGRSLCIEIFDECSDKTCQIQIDEHGVEELHLSEGGSIGENPFSQLKNLRILSMKNCGLKKAPGGLDCCGSLEELHLRGNRNLHDKNLLIPMLENLRCLDLSNCNLNSVPNMVFELPNIMVLNMNSNKLKELPECFTNLIEKNVLVDLRNNKLWKPPQAICDNASEILNYLKSIAKYGQAHSQRLRVLVVGNTNAGKTSLVNGLLMGQSSLTGKEERTEGIEIRKWYPFPTNDDLELEIWDFGGHMEYQSVSHYFFEEHSLFLLVVDVSVYEKCYESYRKNVGKWIDELKSIVLQPVVMVAATKSDLVSSNDVYERCQHMLSNIVEQEKMDMISLKSNLEKLVKNDYLNTGRKEKLSLMMEKRPIFPKRYVSASYEKKIPCNENTFIVIASAGNDASDDAVNDASDDASGDASGDAGDDAGNDATNDADEDSHLGLIQLRQQLVGCGSDPYLFPHLATSLPLLWIKIEELLPSLRDEVKSRVGPKYIAFDELEEWLCQHLQMFNQTLAKKNTLEAVLGYLVRLGKVLRFKRVKQLKDFIFPDPQWLIMLVKEVVHHNLESHLKFAENFKACEMDVEKFKNQKQDLIDNGLLSESMLRCIWFHAVPEKADFEKLIPLLYHFCVGYKMTLKEAVFKGRETSNNFILIPALMPETPPHGIENWWPTTVPEYVFETKSLYSFRSILPVGLFERQMARCHQNADYMLHWKEGFFGVINSEEPKEVKCCFTKENGAIEFSSRVRSIRQIHTLWEIVLRFHQIFANMLQELWPELRYVIYNKCPKCDEFEHEMDLERLLEAPHAYSRNVFCKRINRPHHVKVNKESVFPPQGNLIEILIYSVTICTQCGFRYCFHCMYIHKKIVEKENLNRSN